MNRVWIGTSGWSYRHWRGVFYPKEVKPAGFLEYYTRHFDCVELNASFYRLPKKETVAGWVQRTPGYFRFAAKLHRLVTHQKKLHLVEEALAAYFSVMEALKPRLGPILIQLPPSLSFDAERVDRFLRLLTTDYGSYRYALEARHNSWMNEEALTLLKRYAISWTIAHSDRFPYLEAVTAPWVYLRFHGPGRLYASNYTDEMLAPFADRIARWVQQGHTVWAFFNNDVGGHAVRNALTLRRMVAARLGEACVPEEIQETD